MRKRVFITEIDFENNVAFDDNGHIFPIEDYVDEDENPCLPEEAIAVNIRIGPNSYKRVDIEGED